MNVTNHVEAAALHMPEQTALIFEGQVFSYAQLNALGNRAANAFAELGMVRGDPVALFIPNLPAFIVAYLGILKLGAIVVPINTALKATETQFILNDSAATFLITTAELYQTLAGVELPHIHQLIFVEGMATGNGRSLDALLAQASPEFATARMSADEAAALHYTSGTTGTPKGAIISHGNVISNRQMCAQAFGFTATDRLLLCLPLFHSFSQTGSLNPCFEVGATLILQRQFEVNATIRTIQAECVSRFVGVPSLYLLLYEQAEPAQLASVQHYLSSATTLPLEVARKWQAKYGVAIDECYGLTETGVVSFNDRVQEKVGSVGKMLAGVDLRVVNPQGEPVAPGELGEVVGRGPTLMPGYWQRPEATAQAMQEGWFYTGDIGQMDRDGYLYIVDRIKDMINVGGTKVYSSEVENVLYQHEAVAEAAVYGSADALFGEQVCATIVPRAGQTITPAELITFCRQHLADFKVPTIIQLSDHLPKSPTGKILKRILREQMTVLQAQQTRHPQPIAQSVEAIEAWIVDWLVCELGLSTQTIELNRPFAELGMTSALSVNLVRSLGEWLACPLLPILAWNFPTVAALAQHLAAGGQLPTPAAPPLDPTTVPARFSTDEAAAKQLQSEAIAVIGLGCRLPGDINTPAALWTALHNGLDTVRTIPATRWDVEAYYDPTPATTGKMYVRTGSFLDDIDQFDAHFFGLTPSEAASLDPQQRLLLEVTWEALEHGGLAPARLQGSATGIFIGSFWDDYSPTRLFGEEHNQIDGYRVLSSLRGLTAGRIAYLLGLHGPAMQLDTACSSSLLAVHQACQALRNRECSLALAGGVNLVLAPEQMIGLSQMQALAPDGRCKPFAAQADGFGRGEGCGMVVLKRYADAMRDGDPILAVVRGSAVNHDGRSNGLTVPNGLAQTALVQQALSNANVTPDQIQYIEAHGTGTILGDPIEVMALADVFGQARPTQLALGSVKSNFGHLEGAAGIAAFLKVVLALQHGEIPPNLHFDTPNPHIPWAQLPFVVPTQPIPWPAPTEHGSRLAGISSFGMSGTNVHVILGTEEAGIRGSEFGVRKVDANLNTEPLATTETNGLPERPWHILNLSAKSKAALHDLAQSYHDYVAEQPDLNLGNVGYTANVGRSHFAYRLSVAAETTAQLQQKLAGYLTEDQTTGFSEGYAPDNLRVPKVAFLFTGQGSQYVNMGRALYETQPVFRDIMNQCAALLAGQLEHPLLDILYPVEREEIHNSLINETSYTQPALFALEVALATLWQAWGVQPDLLIGHSVGELAAACVAGVFSLADGLTLVAARGRLMQALPQDGEMVAVQAGEAQVQQAIASYYMGTELVEVSIAAINGPDNIVISGQRATVSAIVAQLTATGIKTRPLTVSHAFHSPLMDPILAEFQQIAASITYHQPNRPLVSNVTGKLAGDEITTPEYWVRHVREAVRFADGVATLHVQGLGVFLEIGPKPTLLGRAKAIFDLRLTIDEANTLDGIIVNPLYLPSLREGQGDWPQLLKSLGELYVQGVEVDWAGFDQAYPRCKVVLPTYPFQRQRHWIEASHSRTTDPTHRDSMAYWLDAHTLEGLTESIIERGQLDPTARAIITKVLTTLDTERHAQQMAAQVESLLYEIAWERQPKSITVTPPTIPGRWLVLADEKGVGATLRDQLAKLGEAVDLVH
ncbi:MAG: AMP-binding protein, partial [Chloroflexi bacterium]|nr:AMP-binding protein [Chloroflexota bacterium]